MLAPWGAPKNALQKRLPFLTCLGASWAPRGHLFGYPGTIFVAKMLRKSHQKPFRFLSQVWNDFNSKFITKIRRAPGPWRVGSRFCDPLVLSTL